MAIKFRTKYPVQRYEARARVAKALAHPTRLLLLDALGERERCVCELTELVGADQSTVSKHLAVLKEVGLLIGRKEGSMSFYRLNCKCLDGFFTCIESVLKQNLEAQQAAMGL
jgi:ArsR family transcriptional regulator